METFAQAVKRLSKNKKNSNFYGYVDPKNPDHDIEISILRKFARFRNKQSNWEDFDSCGRSMQRKKVIRIVVEWRIPIDVPNKTCEGHRWWCSPHYKKKDAVCGLVYVRESNEYREKPVPLIDKVINQIKMDINMGDLTAITELLESTPKTNLKSFLSEIDH